MEFTAIQWVAFHLLIAFLLAIDLSVGQRRAHAPSLREATAWWVVWILAAILFSLYLRLQFGNGAFVDFVTAYIIEETLSIDNLFVFAVIFRYFAVEFTYQHRVLFWGIVGVILTRGTFIVAGVKLLEVFQPMIYVFGAVLVYSGLQLLRQREPTDPAKNPVVKQARKLLPITSTFHEARFFVNNNGRRMVTPLFLTLVAVESTDIVFAIDSVPAVLAITPNLVLAYTSNIFAVLGLRALYFLLIQVLLRIRYLHIGLALLLTYLGGKMLASDLLHIPTITSLLIVTAILGSAIIASLPQRKQATLA